MGTILSSLSKKSSSTISFDLDDIWEIDIKDRTQPWFFSSVIGYSFSVSFPNVGTPQRRPWTCPLYGKHLKGLSRVSSMSSLHG
jgi:hypothetical protein